MTNNNILERQKAPSFLKIFPNNCLFFCLKQEQQVRPVFVFSNISRFQTTMFFFLRACSDRDKNEENRIEMIVDLMSRKSVLVCESAL